MARFFFPLILIALGALGLAEHRMITDTWNAIYPQNAAEQEALAQCAQDDSGFNRFNAASRTECYEKHLQVQLPTTSPGLTVGVPGAPAHAVPHAPTLHTTSPQR